MASRLWASSFVSGPPSDFKRTRSNSDDRGKWFNDTRHRSDSRDRTNVKQSEHKRQKSDSRDRENVRQSERKRQRSDSRDRENVRQSERKRLHLAVSLHGFSIVGFVVCIR
jgi:hypothetical protein